MPQWTYRVNVTNSLNMPNTKIYEANPIDNWVKVGDALQPVFASAPIEKERFIDVKQSNRYNINKLRKNIYVKIICILSPKGLEQVLLMLLGLDFQEVMG